MTSQNIPNKILNWYDNNKRDLPWRKKVSRTQKEYFTLVSEFMLQQTQVKTVIPYFENFISKIPDLKSLSRVRDAKLMKCWEGLGYYSRARNLKKSAKQIINELNQKEDIIYGPFSADTFFCNNYAKYDAILAVYHDQGLIPFKTISFGEGVNYSAGLPIIRTSPDHGTGFDIAGKSIADPSSFKNALKLALNIYEARNKIL